MFLQVPPVVHAPYLEKGTTKVKLYNSKNQKPPITVELSKAGVLNTRSGTSTGSYGIWYQAAVGHSENVLQFY